MAFKCQMAVRACMIICGISGLLLETLCWIVAAARERLHGDKWLFVSSSARTPPPKPLARHQLLLAEMLLSGKQERVTI